MARIESGRILFGVSYKLASDNDQCVADWFTESSEAHTRKNQLERLAVPGPYQVYTDVQLMCVRLPDTLTASEKRAMIVR